MVSLVANFSGFIRYFYHTTRILLNQKAYLAKTNVNHLILNNIGGQYKKIFVIGDIHGCYDEMQELLKDAEIDQHDTSTLKIFVGDLINKGPKNLEVLDSVMNMPSAISVRGNHDEVVLNEILKMSENHNYEPREKNKWIKQISENGKNYLKNLPYTISIPELNSIIVHAGLVPNEELSNQKFEDMISMRNVVEENFEGRIQYQSTNSDQLGVPWASAWNGPQHVYFGHDAKRLIQKYPLATGLDSGCVYGKRLSGIFIFGPRKGEMISVQAKKVYQVPTG